MSSRAKQREKLPQFCSQCGAPISVDTLPVAFSFRHILMKVIVLGGMAVVMSAGVYFGLQRRDLRPATIDTTNYFPLLRGSQWQYVALHPNETWRALHHVETEAEREGKMYYSVNATRLVTSEYPDYFL